MLVFNFMHQNKGLLAFEITTTKILLARPHQTWSMTPPLMTKTPRPSEGRVPSSLIYPLKMVMFHSYVNSPEGMFDVFVGGPSWFSGITRKPTSETYWLDDPKLFGGSNVSFQKSNGLSSFSPWKLPHIGGRYTIFRHTNIHQALVLQIFNVHV